MFRRSASLAIPHRKSFVAIPSVSLVLLGTRIATSNCRTNRSMKLPSFRHSEDQFLTTNKKGGGRKMGLCFERFLFLTFRGPLASHDSNPYPNRSRIAQHNATKLSRKRQFVHKRFVHNFGDPLPPPSQTSEVMDFLLNFYQKDLKQNCQQTQPKVRN